MAHPCVGCSRLPLFGLHARPWRLRGLVGGGSLAVRAWAAEWFLSVCTLRVCVAEHRHLPWSPLRSVGSTAPSSVCSIPTRLLQVITFEAADAGDGLDAELDAADFDTTEFINRRFPTEASLEGLDVYLARTDREVKHLDEAISEVQPPSPLVCTHLSSLWGACVRAAWGAGGEAVGRGGGVCVDMGCGEASCCCFVCFFGCSSHSALLLGAVKGRGEE